MLKKAFKDDAVRCTSGCKWWSTTDIALDDAYLRLYQTKNIQALLLKIVGGLLVSKWNLLSGPDRGPKRTVNENTCCAF